VLREHGTLVGYYIALIVLTVLMEAGGEPLLGQEMVARVVVNRMNVSGMSAEEVLYQPGQFAVWVNLDVRMKVLKCAAREELTPGCLGIGKEEWWRTYRMVLRVYGGSEAPPGLEGMMNFDNPAFWPQGLPKWLRGDCQQIGKHRFCR